MNEVGKGLHKAIITYYDVSAMQLIISSMAINLENNRTSIQDNSEDSNPWTSLTSYKCFITL
jgi:hypothetical protein